MTSRHFYEISPRGEIVELSTLEEALAFRGDGFIWLDFCEPAREDLEQLIEPLDLHPLSVEDCLDENQIPKVEDYPRHTFLLFNGFHFGVDKIAIYEVDMFIGERVLVTVHHEDENNQAYLSGLERFVKQDIQNGCQGPAFLAHVILDGIVDRKFAAIEALEDELNSAEEMVLDNPSQFDPAVLLRLRRELLALRKSLFHEREVLVKICRNDCRFISERAILMYRDIYDHLAKFFELTESYRDIVTSLMEMYLSILNNQMAKAANDTNATVRRLTFITTIFMPLTLLAGVGGMSEWSMMTGPENWRIAYPAFLLGMATLGVASYFLLKWIEKRGKDKDGS